MLNLFNFVQFAHARHSSSKFGSALAQSQMSASVRGDVLEMARCEILKQVQDDICVLTAHYSQLITQNVLMSNLIAYRSPLTAHQRSIENSLQNRIFV